MGVQFMSDAKNGRVWSSVSDPVDIAGDVTERVSLDISPADYAFLKRYAKYRNALAKAQGKKLKASWSRKSLGESFLAIQCDAARHQLKQLFDAVGDFPRESGDKAKDAAAMLKYAKAVIAWDDRQNQNVRRQHLHKGHTLRRSA